MGQVVLRSASLRCGWWAVVLGGEATARWKSGFPPTEGLRYRVSGLEHQSGVVLCFSERSERVAPRLG
jgi:hypothetical protein